jgi:hypothetical protein
VFEKLQSSASFMLSIPSNPKTRKTIYEYCNRSVNYNYFYIIHFEKDEKLSVELKIVEKQ